MSVSRDTSKGTWTVYARYTDWQGKVKVLHKRGFKAKRDALQYEREYLCRGASHEAPADVRVKAKSTPNGVLLARVDKKDATRLIAVSSDIVQIWL